MTEKTGRIIAKAMSEELTIEELLQEKDKSNRPGVVKGIEQELSERNYKCPECTNELMRNESESVWYCPTGHYEVEE